jgi:hypothetical protein
MPARPGWQDLRVGQPGLLYAAREIDGGYGA